MNRRETTCFAVMLTSLVGMFGMAVQERDANERLAEIEAAPYAYCVSVVRQDVRDGWDATVGWTRERASDVRGWFDGEPVDSVPAR